MCVDPVTAASLSALAMNTIGQIQQASAQADALNDSAEARADETSRQLQQQAGERAAQGRRERARLLVAAGEAGLATTSQSFEAELANNFGAQNRDIATIRANARAASSGLATQVATQASTIRSPLQIVTGAAADAGRVYGNRPIAPAGLKIPTDTT